MRVFKLLATLAAVALLLGAPGSQAATTELGGVVVTDCNNNGAANSELCGAGYTCHQFVDEDGSAENNFACRALTGEEGAKCTAKAGCEPGLLCLKNVCTKPDTLFITTVSTKFTTLPDGMWVAGNALNGNLTEEEKYHFASTSAGDPKKVRCLGTHAVETPLELRDKYSQTATVYPACMTETLAKHNVSVTYANKRITVKVDHPTQPTGFALIADSDIFRKHVNCLGTTVDMVEMEPANGRGNMSWIFYGPLLYGGGTDILCEIYYETDHETGDEVFSSKNFLWITPVFVDSGITIADYKKFSAVQLVHDDAADGRYKTGTGVPVRGSKKAIIQPAQNGCGQRNKYLGFERTLTLSQLINPDDDDRELLDGDANGRITPLDIDLAMARSTSFGVSLCDYGTDRSDGKVTIVYKQDNPNLLCFFALRNKTQQALLVPCHADPNTSPQALAPPENNVYKLKYKVTKPDNLFLVFMSVKDHSDIYQMSSDGRCSEHRNLRACTADEKYCTHISSGCDPIGVSTDTKVWQAPSISATIIITLIVGVVIFMILHSFKQASKNGYQRLNSK